MGGGTYKAMRAASKVAGPGVGARVVGGLRGAAVSAAPAEQAMRKSSVPVSAILSSSATATADVSPVQRPAMELDGWESAVVEGDLVISAGEPMPRVVFTGVPSLHEAKEATVELKEALDMVYLSSPKSSESREVAISDTLSGLSLISKPDPESDSLHVVGAAPSHALKAFKLLSTSHEVQNVVASIASDKKFWGAVMENPVLKEFLESNKKKAASDESGPKKSEDSSDSSNTESWGNRFKGMCKNIKDNVANLNVLASIASDEKVRNAGMQNSALQKYLESNKKTAESDESVPKNSEDSSDSSNTEPWGNWFKGMCKNIKDNVANRVSSLSTRFQNIFASSSDAKEEAEASHTTGMGTSIMRLVIMIIMVVLFKRI